MLDAKMKVNHVYFVTTQSSSKHKSLHVTAPKHKVNSIKLDKLHVEKCTKQWRETDTLIVAYKIRK